MSLGTAFTNNYAGALGSYTYETGATGSLDIPGLEGVTLTLSGEVLDQSSTGGNTNFSNCPDGYWKTNLGWSISPANTFTSINVAAYQFDQSFVILSQDLRCNTTTSSCCLEKIGNTLEGHEGVGIIQFTGIFSAIS